MTNPVQTPTAIKQWSYSRLHTYETCPLKAKFKVVDKLADPAGPAAGRGVYWHAVLEKSVTGELTAMPELSVNDPKLGAYAPLLAKLRDIRPLLEHRVGFTREWKETTFFAKNVWCRSVYDVMYYDAATRTVHTGDWKTGKSNPDHVKQLELYNATGLLLFPEAVKAEAVDWYVDIGKPEDDLTHTLTRAGLPDVLRSWELRVRRMETDTVFPARPGKHCMWCNFAKKKGGPCTFG